MILPALALLAAQMTVITSAPQAPVVAGPFSSIEEVTRAAQACRVTSLRVDTPSTFGQFRRAMPARVMQFALRYEF